MSEVDKLYKEVEFKTLSGDVRSVTFKLLKRKQASAVYASTVKTGLLAFSKLKSGGDGTSIVAALEHLDHDRVIWPLASALLKGAVVRYNPKNRDDFEVIQDLETTDYFDDNWDEMYLMIWHGINVNYPKSFSRLRAKLAALSPAELKNLDGTTKQA